MVSRLKEKVAMVTGAAGGIGAATARALVAEGARVVLTDLDKSALLEVERMVAASAPEPGRVSAMAGDVASLADTQATVAHAIDRFGSLDIAVLNAGIEGRVQSIIDMDVADFEKVLKVNLTGCFIGLKCCMKAMHDRGGAIIMTASVAGLIGTPDLSAYTASKHGLIGLMRSAALEGAPRNIRVNTVNPSPVETRMMRSLEEGFAPGAGEEVHRAFEQTIPLKRYAMPDDVAGLFVYLASDEARFLTGQTYVVDGGMTTGVVRA